MKLILEINMDNAAFDIMPERELQALLTKVSLQIGAGKVESGIIDVNGNKVGFFEIQDED